MQRQTPFLASKTEAFYLFMVNLHLSGRLFSVEGGDGGNVVSIMNNKH